LKPTKLNLFGLDIRFRFTEELLRKEKESKRLSVLSRSYVERRLTSIAKAKPDSRENEQEEAASGSRSGLRRKIFNRHGLPDEIKEIISPKPRHEKKDQTAGTTAGTLHQRH
jgi:hypothetical protein